MDPPGASSFGWDKAPNLNQRRIWGTAVPLPGGTGGSTKIMALGGSTVDEMLPSSNTTEVFDETNPSSGWTYASPMNIGRGHANTVLLPDGSMVEVGGGVGRDNTYGSPLHAANEDQKQVELWNPAQRRLAPRPGPGGEPRLPLHRPAAARRPRDVRR